MKSVAKTRLLRARLAGETQAVQLRVLPDNTAGFPPQLASVFFPNGFTQPPVPLVDLRADARLVLLRCTNLALNPLPRAPAADQALRQLVAAVQTALGGEASPAEAGLANLQVFSGQRTGLQSESQLQALLHVAERPAEQASVAPAAPLLALTNGPAPAAAVESSPPQSNTPAGQQLQSQSLQQQPVHSEPAREEPSSAAAAVSGGMAASMQALAVQHYGTDLPPLPGCAEEGVPDRASAKPKTSGKGRGKGGRGKGKVKPTGQKGSTEEKAFKRPAAVVQTVNKRPAAAASSTRSGSGKLTVQECRRLRPQGCSKCRQRPGCCPSCWRGRGIVVV